MQVGFSLKFLDFDQGEEGVSSAQTRDRSRLSRMLYWHFHLKISVLI